MIGALKKLRRFQPLSATVIGPLERIDVGREVALPEGYHPANPSIARYGDGYICCVRGVNYVYEDPRSLTPTFTAGAAFHSVYRFVLLDRQLRVAKELVELDEQLADQSLEDIRLFVDGDELYGIASKSTHAPMTSTMCLIRFGDGLEPHLELIESPHGAPVEKNWCPFTVDRKLHFAYAFAPTSILALAGTRAARRQCAGMRGTAEKAALRFFDCGSTPGVRVGDDTMFVTHRRHVRLPSMEYAYASRLYYLSADQSRISRSRYFSIGAPSIQFISGIEVERNQVLLAYGVNDCQAFVARFDKRAFFTALKPGSGSEALRPLDAAPSLAARPRTT